MSKNTRPLKFIAIIPARFASTRFPGKPLAMLGTKPVIAWVMSRAAEVLGADNVYVATDDQRIAEAVKRYGGHPVMTSAYHKSGTDRVRQAYDEIASDADVVINVQGDEPFIDPSQIRSLMQCYDNDGTDIATLARPYPADGSFEGLADPNLVKLVCDLRGQALYFSRSVIPYLRGHDVQTWPSMFRYLTHVGIYAYRAEVLRAITRLPQSPLEKAESLEQLRWLQNGYTIRVALTDVQTVGIDTPADLEQARAALAKAGGANP